MKKKFTCRLFVLIIFGNSWICDTCTIDVNDLQGCECNIANACDPAGNPKHNWYKYLPEGVDQFGYVVQSKQSLAYACEDETVSILFDCNSKIPLYSATVMTGEQLSAGSSDRPSHFRKSQQILGEYQQEQLDYYRSSERSLCYKKRSKTTLVVDHKWLGKASNLVVTSNYGRGNKAQARKTVGKRQVEVDRDACIPEMLKTAINKGHLVASNYGRGDKDRMKATFFYTNVVPQFGSFNSGPWQSCETRLVIWGRNNCALDGAENVQLFIVVGAVPSTVYGASEARWFGFKGFSNYKDDIYPVNVPKRLWTAACCTFNYQGEPRTKNTAFERINDPGIYPCNKLDIVKLTKLLSRGKNIDVFPNSPECKHVNNYVPLQC